MFYKKILFQVFYFKIACLIQCVYLPTSVIVCEMYYHFLREHTFYNYFLSVFDSFVSKTDQNYSNYSLKIISMKSHLPTFKLLVNTYF